MKYILSLLTLGLLWLPAGAWAQAEDTIPAPVKISNETTELTQGVSFTISTTNSEMFVDSTNQLECHVMNLAESNIVVFSVSPHDLTAVFLTNSEGTNYQLVTLETNNTSLPGLMYPLAPGEEIKWSVPLIIDRKMKPGTYQLTARQMIRTAGIPPVDWRYEQAISIDIKRKRSLFHW